MCLTKSSRKISGLHFRTCHSICSAVGDSMGELPSLPGFHCILQHVWEPLLGRAGQVLLQPLRKSCFHPNLWVLLCFVGLESQHLLQRGGVLGLVLCRTRSWAGWSMWISSNSGYFMILWCWTAQLWCLFFVIKPFESVTVSGAICKLCADPVDNESCKLWFLGMERKGLFEPTLGKVLVIESALIPGVWKDGCWKNS